jgi:hypothetical protein
MSGWGLFLQRKHTGGPLPVALPVGVVGTIDLLNLQCREHRPRVLSGSKKQLIENFIFECRAFSGHREIR